jgi:predicted MPP superfamily phosphohydrolase
MQIPFVGGLIAPNQGFFPKYSEGVHQKDKTSMVISRGIGNSLCPLRVNNRPEVILIELK